MTGQMTLPVREQRLESPEGLMAAALTWIRENPDGWSFIVGAAQRDSLDNVPVSPKLYIEMLRRRSVTWATDRVKLPNAFSPAFARILREWHPEVRPWLRLAPSKLDGVVIPPRPY